MKKKSQAILVYGSLSFNGAFWYFKDAIELHDI